MRTVVLSSRSRLVWLFAGMAALLWLAGCNDRHRDDNPFNVPNGSNISTPFE
jgi:hypothetical protein